MVAVDGAVCFWERTKRNCFAFSFACGKGMSAPRRVQSHPALLLSLQDEQKPKGERMRPIAESLDGGR